MLIAGTERWKVTIVEPEALRIALYVRDIEGLTPTTHPDIPPLDPAVDVWPVWSRRPQPLPATGSRLPGGRDVDPLIAAGEWARWWRHALELGTSAIDELKPPGFPALAGVPDLRALMQRHFANASLWSDGLNDDPRIRSAHTAPGLGLNAMIKDLPATLGREPHPFTLRITVIGVRTKHAWVMAPDHLMLTRHLVADLDNAVDWLRPRILSLATSGSLTA